MLEALGPEIAVMAGGSVLGMASKFISTAQKAKAEAQRQQIEFQTHLLEQARGQQEIKAADQKAATDSANAAAARVGVDKWSPWARRVFVAAMLYFGWLLLTAAQGGFDVVVPVEVTKGFNFLGIIDTTKTVTEFVRLENAVVAFDWIKISILAAGSFYLGKS
jgi:hypothetical protein